MSQRRGTDAMPDNIFQHIVANRCGNHGCPDRNFVPPNEAEPTKAPQGSREKIQVLADRAEAGEPLWHDDDADDWSEGWKWRLARVAGSVAAPMA